ncbi:hypothetical protein B0H19DRAFT_850245, partial [Mycena capillaripes]
KSQWQNPTDILTILMIIGGDVVQSALAQLVGYPVLTPVALSFGCVAYSFSAILSAVGAGSILPQPDIDIECINAKSNYSRPVKSWVLARLYRDLTPPPLKTPRGGLSLLFFKTSPSPPGMRSCDWVYYLGVLVIVFQLGVACIPGVIQGNWVILVITAGGMLLVQLTARLPQWHDEMWAARTLKKNDSEVVCLTAGNGSAHVLVVKSEGCGLKLEDLANGRIVPSRLTGAASVLLGFGWIAHLMTVQGVENDGWYLLAIGGVGMLQNIVSAGARRKPSALGFHLEPWMVSNGKHEISSEEKVFLALQDAEEVEPYVGLALLDTFFPGGLRKNEEDWRNKKREQY